MSKTRNHRALFCIAELLPLKAALEGLNAQIQKFETTAGSKAKLLILRGIGHDLISPVGQLKLYIATLMRSLQGEQYQEIVQDINDSLTRVADIASQVKILRDIQNVANPTDLVATAHDEVENLKADPRILSKEITLRYNSSTPAAITLLSQTEVSRILTNLVQNAADASPAKSKIDVERSAKDHRASAERFLARARNVRANVDSGRGGVPHSPKSLQAFYQRPGGH